MNRNLLLACVLSFYSFFGIAVTPTIPANRLDVFSTFSSSDWTRANAGYTTNSIYILKSTASTQLGLMSELYNLGIAGMGSQFILDSRDFAGIPHVRITDKDNSYIGQCVDFVKTMVGSSMPVTTSWYPGTKLSTIPSNQLVDMVPRGTVIAYFDPNNGAHPYNYYYYGRHVAIVLNFTFNNVTMEPTGMTVIDQNFLLFDLKIGGVSKGQSPQSISRHFLNWNDPEVKGGGNYHIVDIH